MILLEKIEMIEKEVVKFHFSNLDAVIEAEYDEMNGYQLTLCWDAEDSTSPGALKIWVNHIEATVYLMYLFGIENLKIDHDEGQVLYWTGL